MRDYVTVYTQQGQGLLIEPEVARRFGVRSGQRLDDALFGRVMVASCEEGIAECELQIAINDVFDAADS